MKREAIPVVAQYMEVWEMEERFWGNFLLISNIKTRDRNTGMAGGIVRYYSEGTEKLYELIMEMDQDDATYGSCMIKYIGNGDTNSVGGVFI